MTMGVARSLRRPGEGRDDGGRISDSSFKEPIMHVFAFSRHDLPEVCMRWSLEKGGSRECRVRAAPAVSCAKLCEETHTSIQVQRKHSGIPRAMVLRLMPRSPRRRIRLVTVAAGLMATRFGWIDVATGSLTPATGARTTQFCRTLWRRSSCALLLAHGKPPCERTRADAIASTTSHPNVRDDRDTPLVEE